MSGEKKLPEARELKIPAWYRRSFQLIGQAAPSVASSWAMNLFFTPSRIRVSAEARAALSRGQRFSFDSRYGKVAGWSWGTGAPVLLAHGWSGHSGQMAGIAEALVTAGYRAIAVDMPAHGESEGKRASLVHFADAMADASRLFGPFHGVVAHSLGAGGTMLALKRGSLRVERVVFIAPPAELESFWARFRRGIGVTPNIWREMRQKSENWLKLSFEDIIPLRVAVSLTAPLLIVHDQDDREIPIDEARSLRAVWPGAELHETKKLGHVRILRDPDVIQRIVHFLSRSDSKSAAA